MELIINGEAKQFEALKSVQELVDALALNPRQVALERNLAIVPRGEYSQTPLAEGDRIEIVAFIGGG